MDVKLKTGKSKKGNEYKYLQIKIGEYEGRLYPTKAESAYISGLISKDAHDDFKDGLEDIYE